MSASSVKAAALLVLSAFHDVTAQDVVVTTAQATARTFREQAAVSCHRSINIERVTTTTAVGNAIKASGEAIASDMRFTTNTMVGCFASAGWVITLGGGSIPENGSVARLTMDIKLVGQTRVKQIIRAKDQTTPAAYDTIRAEAQVIIDATKAAKEANKSDATLLKAAQSIIDAAVKLDTTDEGTAVALALIAALTARYVDTTGDATGTTGLALVG